MKPTILCPKCSACDWQFQLIQIGFLRPAGVSVGSSTKVDKEFGLLCRACGYIENNKQAWKEVEEAFN
ncbi:hypothetical protein EON83_10975 [bacterium]|nr:MAG: hypothetical protein EON83_10975 [bacterium]